MAKKTEQEDDKLKRSIIISMILHVVVLGLIIWGSSVKSLKVSGGGGAIDAVMVDISSAPNDDSLKKQAKEKKSQEADREKKLKEKQLAKEQEEAKRLEEAKKAQEEKEREAQKQAEEAKRQEDARKLEQEKRAEEAKIKEAQIQEAKRLEAEKQARIAEQKAEEARKQALEAEKLAQAQKAEQEKRAKEALIAAEAAKKAEDAKKVEEAKKAQEVKRQEEAKKAQAEKAAQEKARKDEEQRKAAAKKAQEEKRQADIKSQKEREASVSDLINDLASTPNAQTGDTKEYAKGQGASHIAGSGGASQGEVDAYTNQIKEAIKIKLNDYHLYKGKTCDLKITIARDGGRLINASIVGGDDVLCQLALSAALEANIPKPPSDALYKKVKNMTIGFEPD